MISAVSPSINHTQYFLPSPPVSATSYKISGFIIAIFALIAVSIFSFNPAIGLVKAFIISIVVLTVIVISAVGLWFKIVIDFMNSR